MENNQLNYERRFKIYYLANSVGTKQETDELIEEK